MRAAGLVALWLASACGGEGGGVGDPYDPEPSDGGDGSGGPMTGGDGESGGPGSEGGDDPGGGSDDGGPIDDPGDPFEPAPPYEPYSEEIVSTLEAMIDGTLGAAAVSSASHGILIVDLETDQVLYDRNADDLLVPASNTKMFTTAVAIDALGEDHRFETLVLADAMPDGQGVVQGDLYLVGRHDFTWSTFFYDSARFPLDRLAARLLEAGVTEVTGTVHVHGEMLYEGESLGFLDVSGERATAGARFADALSGAGISFGGTSISGAFEPPEALVELARWNSPPLSSSCVHLNGPSHNEFADLLIRHLGWELGGESSYTEGGNQMLDWMAGIGSDIEGAAWLDGSGLSHGNQVDAWAIVDLLAFMSAAPDGLAWTRSLAIGGYRGTLRNRMTGPDLVGRVYAKTGTLPSIGVVSTSGYLFEDYDGRRIAFSILMNGVSSVSGARSIHDAIVSVVAADVRGIGPRPAAPVLRRVAGASNSDVVEIAWEGVPDVDGYVVWLSPDGRTWDLADARWVEDTSHRAGHIELGPDVYVRVSAVRLASDGPVYGPPSDVYGARAEPGKAPILVVDGNDRWEAEPQVENSLGEGHDFIVDHLEALGGPAFDVVANEAVADGDVVLDDYEIVVWTLGEESQADETFDATEQELIAAYLDGGGRLFVSGAEVGYDLVEQGTPADASFFEDVLHAGYEADDAQTVLVAGAGVPDLGFNTPGGLVANYADVLLPSAGSSAFLDYVGGFGGIAGVAFEDRVVVLGFPFETIDNVHDRTLLMSKVLERLGG